MARTARDVWDCWTSANGVSEYLQTPFKNNESPSPGGRIHGRNPARRSTHWQGNEALFRSVDPLIGDSSIEALSRLAFRVSRIWRAGSAPGILLLQATES